MDNLSAQCGQVPHQPIGMHEAVGAIRLHPMHDKRDFQAPRHTRQNLMDFNFKSLRFNIPIIPKEQLSLQSIDYC